MKQIKLKQAELQEDECDRMDCHKKHTHFLIMPWGAVALCDEHYQEEQERSASLAQAQREH